MISNEIGLIEFVDHDDITATRGAAPDAEGAGGSPRKPTLVRRRSSRTIDLPVRSALQVAQGRGPGESAFRHDRFTPSYWG